MFDGGEPLARRALFFTTGQHQSCELAKTLGCQFNEKGTVHTGRHESTHVPGLYVAGDASRDVQWVVIAAAEGAEAAFAITQDLIKSPGGDRAEGKGQKSRGRRKLEGTISFSLTLAATSPSPLP